MTVYIRRVSDFDSDKVSFRGKGMQWTATAGVTSNLDYKFTEERLVCGGQLILTGHAPGDSGSLVIIDKDNVMGYGAEFVLDGFITDWFFVSDEENQGVLSIPFPAQIPANLYLRIIYVSTGSNNVNVRFNMLNYKVN